MKQRESGFTIIETTLVLAITGLVIALTMVGVGNALNQQRYTDAVNQAVDFFRGQYTQASSTVNNRPDSETCDGGGISVPTLPGNATIPGASSCLLVGKVLRTNDGQHVSVNHVLARTDPSDLDTAVSMTDTALLEAANLIQGNEIDTYQVDWGAKFLVPASSSAASFTLMIIRTPVSGTVRTYSASSSTINVAALLATTQNDLRFCIDQSGSYNIAVAPMGIAVTKNATNPTGVRIIASGECV